MHVYEEISQAKVQSFRSKGTVTENHLTYVAVTSRTPYVCKLCLYSRLCHYTNNVIPFLKRTHKIFYIAYGHHPPLPLHVDIIVFLFAKNYFTTDPMFGS